MAASGLHLPGLAQMPGPRLSLQIGPSAARPRPVKRATPCRARLSDPWKTLGVSHSADETEVKRAHRKLVLQHHPDRNSDDPAARVRFIAIQEAYEIITGKRRGKELDAAPQADSWQFHDWFWKFSMSRRQRTKAQAEGAPDPMPPPELQRDMWKSQVAGLQQKAAARRAAGCRARPAPAAGSGGAAERDTSDVWRSTTKNARRTQPPAAAPSAGAGSFPGSGRAADGGLPRAAVSSAAARAQRVESRAPQQMAAEAAAAPSAAPAAEEGQQQPGAPPLHEVLSHAVHAVHRRRQQHDVAVREHTQRLASHIVALSQQLRSRLLPALHLPSLATVAGIPFSGLRSRAEAARQAPLHVLFGDEVRGRERPAADAATRADAASACGGSAADASSAGDPWGHRPSARFANSRDVRERFTLQLAGLRRRAALKQEVLAEE